jgi:subtilisin-like proprotein convertase family protein
LSFSARQDIPITDLETSQLSIAIADSRPVQGLSVEVDIEHTYIGDLIVQLSPPTELATQLEAPSILLHNRLGGGQNNLKQVYDPSAIPALQKLLGQPLQGTWTLQVADQARYDTGVIRGFTLKADY